MSDKAFFTQVEQNIEIMISDGKLKDAYEKCKRYLSEYPDENVFVNLMRKIEVKVEEKNDKLIGSKIDEVEPLWSKKDYVGILNKLKPLLAVGPNNSKLKNLVQKAQEEYREEIEEMQKNFKEKNEKRLNELLENDEQGLLADLFSMEKNNPGNKQVLKMTKSYRDKLIKMKIDSKEDLLYSEKFEDITNFISQLKRIDKSNKRINDLEVGLKIRQHGTQVEEKGEYIYKSYTHLDTLMRLGKYDKAAKVAEELLAVDKSNKKLLKIKEKAEGKVFSKTRDESIKSIEENLPSLKKDYEADKSQFIKI
jgi:tetratricopeptide (TPR) repeat protein